MNPPMFVGRGVELFDIVLTMHGLDSFEQELKNCVDVALGRASRRFGCVRHRLLRYGLEECRWLYP